MTDLFFIIPSIGRSSLAHTILSLIYLNNKNWNALIIFDGVKKNIELEDERLYFIEIEKSGIEDKKNNAGLVRNYGFEYIKNNNINTSFISFVDDDDTLHPDFFNHIQKDLSLFPDIKCIIYRMMYPNFNVVPHPLTNKLQVKNVGISFIIHSSIIHQSDCLFLNHPYEDFLFLQKLKQHQMPLLISSFVNYFVKTDFITCAQYIKQYPYILIK